jgi:hypothetical protein
VIMDLPAYNELFDNEGKQLPKSTESDENSWDLLNRMELTLYRNLVDAFMKKMVSNCYDLWLLNVVISKYLIWLSQWIQLFINGFHYWICVEIHWLHDYTNFQCNGCFILSPYFILMVCAWVSIK